MTRPIDPPAAPPFPALRIADHPALDFANTFITPGGMPLDFIAEPQALLDWLLATDGLEQAQRMAQEAARRGELARAAAPVIALRDWLRTQLPALFGAPSASSSAALAHLNAWIAKGVWRWRLHQSESGPEFRLEMDYTAPECVAAALAAVVGELLSGAAPASVRKCENPECSLWFHDVSKRGNRRWCSMALCGNRAKAAAHRARLKAGDGA